ncbi:MAG: hypothetical protein ASARMPRED_006749 [Alectoria sarmentosa]|nr:MAG: hypothetical protein ASARMPRED_006749 [Alectoria sarmentosa]
MGRFGCGYNLDHFGDYAWSDNRAGHAEALRIAKDGIEVGNHGDSTDLKDWWDKPVGDVNGKPRNLIKDKDGKRVNLSKEDRLKVAYFYNAFDLHYLSDQFASGHTRSPRMETNKSQWLIKALSLQNTISGLFKFNKLRPCWGGWDSTTGFLHDMDGATGLRVHNKRGDHWIVYGVAQYFLEPNCINRIECCQRSLNENYDTWRTGEYPSRRIKNGTFNPDSDNYDALELEGEKVNSAVNVWGPVQVPMEYKPYSADPKDKKKTTTQMMKPAAPDSDRDVPLDRRDINRQPSSAPTRFIKRFEDVNNTSMILHTRTTNKDPKVHKGIRVMPQVYEQTGSKDVLRSSSDKLFMPTYSTPMVDDFYAVLIGDTRLCGHKEPVVLAGTHPYWSDSSGKLSGQRSLKLLMNALMPNEETRNGLNVVLVSSYERNNTKFKFRVFIKDGTAVPKEEDKEPETLVTDGKREASGGIQNPTRETTGGSAPTTGAKNCVNPSGTVMGDRELGRRHFDNGSILGLQPSAKAPATTTSSSLNTISGQNDFAKYNQYDSIQSTIGGDDLAYFASDPVPPLGPKPINMGVIAGPAMQSGRTVHMLMPYQAVAINVKSIAQLSKFTTATSLVTYGRYQAVPCDGNTIQPSCILMWEDEIGSATLYNLNGGGRLMEKKYQDDDGEYNLEVMRQIVEKDWIGKKTPPSK